MYLRVDFKELVWTTSPRYLKNIPLFGPEDILQLGPEDVRERPHLQHLNT